MTTKTLRRLVATFFLTRVGAWGQAPAMKRLLILLLPILFSPSTNFAQTKIRAGQINLGDNFTFSGSTTLSNPCSAGGYFYVSTSGCYTTLQAAINALPSGASGGGTIFLPCNAALVQSGLTIPSGTVIKGCTPTGIQVASGRSVLQFSADLALSSCQNISFENLVLEFNQTGSGLHITSCQNVNLRYVTINQAGSTSKPAVLLDTNCNISSCNTTNILFEHVGIWCNNAASQYCISGVELTGSGPVNAGSFVTVNRFYDTYFRGNIFGAIDSELNSDSNLWLGVTVLNNYSPGSGSYVLAYNLNAPASDQDVDGGSYYYVSYTGTSAPTSFIRAGTSNGNYIQGSTGGGALSVTDVTVSSGSFYRNNRLDTMQLPGVSAFSVPMISTPGALNAGRIGTVNCTKLTSSNFVFGRSWGTSPSFGAIVGCDSSFFINITSGSGSLGANPTVTLTFADGSFTQAPSCSPYRGDTNSPSAYWAYNPNSATTATFTFVGTPLASTNYTLGVICIAKPN